MNKRQRKKAHLGTLLNASKLRKLLSITEVLKESGHSVGIIPFVYCPYCGCKSVSFFDYPVEYPEVWCEIKCDRCNSQVGGADNSYFEYTIESIESPLIKELP